LFRTPEPLTLARKKRLRLGAVFNGLVAAALLLDGALTGLVVVVVLGVAEALFTALVVWTYLRSPVKLDLP